MQNEPQKCVDTICSMRHGSADEKQFRATVEHNIATALEEQRKAYGGCEKCFGKGYFTELASRTVSPDFHGDKRLTTTISNANPCTCDRGRQFAKVVTTATENDLASANEQAIRANERAAVIAEIKGWLVDEVNPDPKWNNEPCCTCPDCTQYHHNQLRAELRAKLVEMKGEGNELH